MPTSEEDVLARVIRSSVKQAVNATLGTVSAPLGFVWFAANHWPPSVLVLTTLVVLAAGWALVWRAVAPRRVVTASTTVTCPPGQDQADAAQLSVAQGATMINSPGGIIVQHVHHNARTNMVDGRMGDGRSVDEIMNVVRESLVKKANEHAAESAG